MIGHGEPSWIARPEEILGAWEERLRSRPAIPTSLRSRFNQDDETCILGRQALERNPVA